MRTEKLKKWRGMSKENLKKELNDINLEIMKFRSASKKWGTKVPATPLGNPNWGLYQQLKKDKARILTILKEKNIINKKK